MNIIFPELSFTAPGTYSYTMKELTPSDERWLTDDRVYPVEIAVVRNEDGTLTASADYPDGFPEFVNIYCPPEPPRDICKYFNKLPFPMFIFTPPQKTEFTELMKSTPNVFQSWENFLNRFDFHDNI